jgi:ATP-dependent Lhr-like helicase
MVPAVITAGGKDGGWSETPGHTDHAGETSIWPDIDARIAELIQRHRSTIVFCNSRRLAERICARINDIAGETLARAHHGSVARPQRVEIEEALKAGRLRAVIATSSLELGIDMGAVDLVIQVEAPPSVASGMQRIGRAGHQVGAVSRGVILPKFRGDLVACAVAVERMQSREIESLHVPANPLDVLAQQIVAMCAMDDWKLDELAALVRGVANFSDLADSSLVAVLDMLSGRYPSDEFAELRPRVVWDRATNVLTGRPGAQRLAIVSGGVIPDRGMYGVFLSGGGGGRIGELDEEHVYESRVGEHFILGASTWRIDEITRDRVLVTPAPGMPGRMPFWKADLAGRPIEFGRAIGAFLRETATSDADAVLERLDRGGLDRLAASNLLSYLHDQRDATGVIPDDRTIVVERFRDEVGDWRICILSPFGRRVHDPWSLVIEHRVAEALGIDAQTLSTDDGIVVRLPDTDTQPPTSLFAIDPTDVEDAVLELLGSSVLFAARFRDCALRSLLIPRRKPGQRLPLWQTRQRAHQLLQVAAKYGSFPVVLETVRECMQDLFDVPALVGLMAQIRDRSVQLVDVETPMASPFAQSLSFSYLMGFMYEGDQPLAERRAQALALDQRLLAELLGTDELRGLVSPVALADLEEHLQHLADDRRAHDAEALVDLIRDVGDLTLDELTARSAPFAPVSAWVRELTASARIVGLRIGGEERFVVVEDAARYRDALEIELPDGLPDALLEPVPDAMRELSSRYARTHGPFTAHDLAGRYRIAPSDVEPWLAILHTAGRLDRGSFRPGASSREWIDRDVLRRLRRRSLAIFRHEVEAVDTTSYARFSLAWHGVTGSRTPDAPARALASLAGVPIPASDARRIIDARTGPGGFEEVSHLVGIGEATWSGAGALGRDDGWIVLAPIGRAATLLPLPSGEPDDDLQRAVLDALAGGGAFFFRRIVERVSSLDDAGVADALWALVWSGHVTNDALGVLEHLGDRASRSSRRPRMPSQQGPARAHGRWSLVEARSSEQTSRTVALVEAALERHGILVRGAMQVEPVTGSWLAATTVLRAAEAGDRCRRGYFVERLGGSQYGSVGAIDRLRAIARTSPAHETIVLAACDPANPYGAAIPWPNDERTHRAGRKAGASVVLVDGALVAFLERGGRSMLLSSDDRASRVLAFDALAQRVRDGSMPSLALERVDGTSIGTEGAVAGALVEAGFRLTPRGWRTR